MWTSVHDHVILLNGRSLFSLTGLIFIVVGTFHIQRNIAAREEGSKQQSSSLPEGDAEYAMMTERRRHDDQLTTSKPPTVWALILRAVGWVFLAVSQLMTANNWLGWYPGACQIVSCVLFLLMGVLELVVPLPKQVIEVCKVIPSYSTSRAAAPLWISWIPFFGWIIQGAVLISPLGGSIFPCCLCLAVAPMLYDAAQHQPAPASIKQFEHSHLQTHLNVPSKQENCDESVYSPVVFHMGGPIMVYGLFWFWIVSNVMAGNPDRAYLPVYLTGSRTIWAFCGATFVLLAIWLAQYALDEMPLVSRQINDSDNGVNGGSSTAQATVHVKKSPEDFQNGPGFGIANVFVGEVWEVKLIVTASWIVFAVSAFYPYMTSFCWPFLILFTMIAIGVILGLIYEQGMRDTSNTIEVKVVRCRAVASASLIKWSKILCALLIALVLEVWAHINWVALYMTLAGSLCFVGGHFVLHFDRKRGGQTWMTTQTSQDNPQPVVYSYGSLLVPLGMILLAWAMSMRNGII